MRIVAFPYKGTAYNASFYAAVEKKGVDVVAGEFYGRWILDNVKKSDTVHIGWPSFYYTSSGGLALNIKSFIRFALLFSLLKIKAGALVWTAHNLLPHQRFIVPRFDIWARKYVIQLSDKIFVHGEEVRRLLTNYFSGAENKCVTIPHGNWILEYSDTVSQESARRTLRIPTDSYVYLMFGRGERYKNVEGLIRAFKQSGLKNALLLISGEFRDEVYLRELQDLSGKSNNIRIDSKFIPDEEVPTYLSASNIVCIPYREILTSGSAMLAFSFGRPVISIDRGFLRDVVTDDSGILVNPGDDTELTDALVEAQEKHWSEGVIKRHAERFTFSEAAHIFLDHTTQLIDTTARPKVKSYVD